MKERWVDLSGRRNWESDTSLDCWRELSDLYQSEDRFYHGLTHIEDCLEQFERGGFNRNVEMELAIWFHDVIYDAHRSDNEADSGRWAVNWLSRLGEEDAIRLRVARLIQITDHRTEPEGDEETHLIDIDLSILGREREVYLVYASKIRLEYSFVPDDEYKKGRSEILERFLKRDRIYRTDEFFFRYEESARMNLKAELDLLATSSE